MNTFKYYRVLIISKLLRKGNNYIVSKMRKEGMKIGYDTKIFSNISSSEPYLISIGDNCTISTEVVFLTHDASIGLYGGGRNIVSDVCGKISIGNNVFIGNRAIILYGVSIPNNTIIAAGTVVTKSFYEEGYIIGGNPGKVIGKIEHFVQKTKPFHLCLNQLDTTNRKLKILSSKLIER